MTDETLKFVVATIATMIPATIAALSSLRNGRSIHKVDDRIRNGDKYGKTSTLRKCSKKRTGSVDDGNTASNPDWYRPPDLD